MKGYVYLLFKVTKSGEESYKIGITKNDPEKRVAQLQTGNEAVINLLKYYKSENYLKIERMIHNRYKIYKTESMGEWFDLPDNEVINFLTTCKEVDNIINFLKEHNPFFK
jgi:hypothetical protein